MGYDLGVDLGTTFTAAAVAREGRATVATLGTRAFEMPSVVYLRSDGEMLVGEAAERRHGVEPYRLGRDMKRRIGDPTPVVLGGTPFAARALMARLLRAAVVTVALREGAKPDRLVVTCPAQWGPYKRDLLDRAVEAVGLRAASLVSEPVAAAVHYGSTTRVPAGGTIAVYDLGGGTFDAAVVRRTDDGYEQLGDPQGIEHLGGIDFDEAVFAHVVEQLDGAVADLDPADPAAVSALVWLRRHCVEAKEALSAIPSEPAPAPRPGCSHRRCGCPDRRRRRRRPRRCRRRRRRRGADRRRRGRRRPGHHDHAAGDDDQRAPADRRAAGHGAADHRGAGGIPVGATVGAPTRAQHDGGPAPADHRTAARRRVTAVVRRGGRRLLRRRVDRRAAAPVHRAPRPPGRRPAERTGRRLPE
jgi:Hsp70 protein